ncbi:lipid II:glycine glycyltransferase FemX [Falsarthrobacter nasiphocae]|uniref:Lipid II:glycine glycyltransferase (Peptidoglycan interpeptide bridge formation enzyme) n=1 Tax=Falsarthrobacter nasiphocae TaxID=189863 RepID=A0AAE3YD11_9MICC|nr:peptidoglycan bridge formation glycyltransferase FemA/FemB family protein [Falsarthrobacter nasiphocae]MDR6891633.1 lipid II:glycine glycyltransferase (peptidoglycan interpeptide bridge formation enzyme) [Falsarthrobacter nasiphocae]
MRPSILQTAPWAEFQRALGKEVVELSGDGYEAVATVERSALGDSLYAAYGPCAEDAAGFERALAALAAEGRRRKLSYVRVEPVSAGLGQHPASVLSSLGLVRAPHDVQPKDTLIIDLSRDEKTILGDMRSSNRNVARNIHKKGVTVRVSEDPQDVRHLNRLLARTAARGEFTSHTPAYLESAASTLMSRGAASLYLAELSSGSGSASGSGSGDDDGGQPEVIAAALVYDTPTTRVYAHAAADDAHRKLSPGVALVVALIRDAKARGQEAVDLWGIAPTDDPEHAWAGFTKFKRSFGGAEVHYPGSWDLPLDRRYTAYRAARRLRGEVLPFLRKAAPLAKRVLPGR